MASSSSTWSSSACRASVLNGGRSLGSRSEPASGLPQQDRRSATSAHVPGSFVEEESPPGSGRRGVRERAQWADMPNANAPRRDGCPRSGREWKRLAGPHRLCPLSRHEPSRVPDRSG
jgi:hypothetical protein